MPYYFLGTFTEYPYLCLCPFGSTAERLEYILPVSYFFSTVNGFTAEALPYCM